MIKYAFCELHPQLRVANVYIKFSTALGNSNLVAKIDDDSICLEKDGEKTKVNLKFPQTVKLLGNCKPEFSIIDEVYSHLRMPIGVPDGSLSGSENVEVIDLMALKASVVSSERKIFIPVKEKKYRVRCAECHSIFISDICFKRVLPLPRASWSEAASDWYCHAHGGEERLKLVPRSEDCLFSSSSHSLEISLLVEGTTISRGRESLCSLCQSSVGLIENSHWNPWCHSIEWLVFEDGKWQSASELPPSPLEAFYFVLNDAFEEEKSFFGRKLCFRNCLPGNKTLILWFVGDNSISLKSSELSETEMELRPSNLHKVLYKIPSSSEKISTDVGEYQVSDQMMKSVMNLLDNTTNLLPPSRRSAAGFSIGFLPVTLSTFDVIDV